MGVELKKVNMVWVIPIALATGYAIYKLLEKPKEKKDVFYTTHRPRYVYPKIEFPMYEDTVPYIKKYPKLYKRYANVEKKRIIDEKGKVNVGVKNLISNVLNNNEVMWSVNYLLKRYERYLVNDTATPKATLIGWILQESSGNKELIGADGEIGIYQIMPYEYKASKKLKRYLEKQYGISGNELVNFCDKVMSYSREYRKDFIKNHRIGRILMTDIRAQTYAMEDLLEELIKRAYNLYKTTNPRYVIALHNVGSFVNERMKARGLFYALGVMTYAKSVDIYSGIQV